MSLGQEIYVFFYRFEIYGLIGLLICSFLMGFIVYKTFNIIFMQKNKVQNYQEFLNIIFKYKNNYLNISSISSNIINIFLLITFYIMVAGFGTYFEQQFSINKTISAILFSVLCYFILKRNISGVKKVNSIIIPILIFIIFVISIVNLQKINFKFTYINININCFSSAFIYCSYNMILVIPLLITLSKYIKNKKQIKITAIFTSLLIFILASSIFFWLKAIDANYENIQMPAVYVIDKLYPKFKIPYGIAILLSIFSTAISVGISFLQNLAKKQQRYPHILKIMCITSVIISNIEFSKLVKILFPLFGYIGLVQIVFIITYKTKDKKQSKGLSEKR